MTAMDIAGYRAHLLQALGQTGVEERYDRDEIIHLEQSGPECVWLVTKGRVRQVFHDSEGYEKTILILSPGDLIGEMSLFDDEGYLFSSEAIDDGTLVRRLSREQFLDFVSGNEQNHLSLLGMITRKFKVIMHQMRDMSFKDVDGRLASLLVRLSEQQGANTPEGTVIDLQLTHQDLANMVVASRATVSRAVERLRKEGLITVRNRKIVVTNLTKLAKFR